MGRIVKKIVNGRRIPNKIEIDVDILVRTEMTRLDYSMNSNPFVCIPSEESVEESLRNHVDCFYTIPREIINFIQHFNRENKTREAKPQTILRRVTIFHDDGSLQYITYEAIEDDIVRCLDRCRETP
jgi:hypothetical protein